MEWEIIDNSFCVSRGSQSANVLSEWFLPEPNKESFTKFNPLGVQVKHGSRFLAEHPANARDDLCE